MSGLVLAAFVAWVWVATRSDDIFLTTATAVIGISFLSVLGASRAASAAGRERSRALAGAPSEADAPAGPEPPSWRWRFHSSRKDVPCTGCAATVSGGYWTPWQYDSILGLHHSRTEQYCAPCAEFRQEAEKLGPEGVADAHEGGHLSDEARDEMLGYLREHDPGEMPV